jgi:hypothetical protein
MAGPTDCRSISDPEEGAGAREMCRAAAYSVIDRPRGRAFFRPGGSLTQTCSRERTRGSLPGLGGAVDSKFDRRPSAVRLSPP